MILRLLLFVAGLAVVNQAWALLGLVELELQIPRSTSVFRCGDCADQCRFALENGRNSLPNLASQD